MLMKTRCRGPLIRLHRSKTEGAIAGVSRRRITYN